MFLNIHINIAFLQTCAAFRLYSKAILKKTLCSAIYIGKSSGIQKTASLYLGTSESNLEYSIGDLL